MKKLGLLILALCLQTFAFAENPYQISLLTCSPGDEIYSVFGHTAIRVKSDQENVDLVFNFGLFDFGTSHFALKFAKGTLMYCLGIQRMDHFVMEYTYDNRLVVEQVLDLSDDQKDMICSKLDHLYLPENRYYQYAFIERNCATEVRDILREAGLEFDVQPIKFTDRDLIELYLPNHKWLRFGINMALGRTIDKPSNTYRAMFLPDFLHDGIKELDEKKGGVIVKENVLNSVTRAESKADWWYSPLFVFSLLLILALLIKHKSFPVTLFAIIGLVGLVVLTLCLFSQHIEVKQNFNLLWCNPLYFVYLPFIIKNKIPKWLPIFFLSLLGLTVIFWITGLQHFDVAIIPMLLTLSWVNLRLIPRKEKEKIKH
ncbi:DUF4105 domain-containing protein [Bacteroidales bacterium OttesenSCG-928-C03]|nr:DUF4105 domain-containing protein [Bacteroidales bacterium OttesenSCG-928-E04]MDL2308035.1 DUF4105 domain-containing protein [Bacteroidales bacterium OttesenSCG-928-C03]MDL2325487.1 DUF4105 domain-containing protein [Bacteroidales bacterium OttesenSCG-928-A14]